MFHFQTFVADTHTDLTRQLNEYFRGRKCIRLECSQLVGDGGEATYAVLVVWEE